MATGSTNREVRGLGEGGMQFIAPFQLMDGDGTTELFGVDASGNVTYAGTSTIASASNFTVTNTAPSASLRDSTASAKDLIIKVDADKAHMYEESAGAAGDIITMDLATNIVGVGTAAPTAATKLDVNGVVAIGAGAVTAPGVAFRTDLDTGMYRIGANNIGIAANGAKVVDIATTGVTVTGGLNSTTAGSLKFKFNESVALADDATLALETSFGSTGYLEVVAANGLAYGQFMLCAAAGAGAGTATLLDTGLLSDDADTDTKVCVFTDGDGTFTLKNRLGSSQNFLLTYKGV